MASEEFDRPVRIAVVGTGQIGRVHVECARRAGAHVIGLLGSTPTRAADKAKLWHVPHVYASLAEVIEDRNVDVVHIASPNHLHYPQVLEVVQGSKNVICEKPLALDASQAQEMNEAVNLAGVINAVCFNFRFYPLMHEARAMVKRGDIGQPLLMTGSYHQDWLLRDTDWNWRLDSVRAGALRAVSDIGSHWLDLLGWVSDCQVQEVMADLYTLIPTRMKPDFEIETFSGNSVASGTLINVTSDDAASIMLRAENGARGSLTVSQVSAGRKNDLRFELAGTEGSLMWSSEASDTLWIGRRGRTSEILLKDPVHLDSTAANVAFYPGGHVEGYGEAFTSLFSTIYADIARGYPSDTPAYPTFSDGYQGAKIADAVLTSAQGRRWAAV